MRCTAQSTAKACTASASSSLSRSTLRRQRGDVLLFVLLALLVTLLGGLYAMRGLLDDTVVAGHAAQRQKNVQMGDAALALATQVITNTLGGTDGSVRCRSPPTVRAGSTSRPAPAPGIRRAPAPTRASGASAPTARPP